MSASSDTAAAQEQPSSEPRQVLAMPAFATYIESYAVPGHEALNTRLLAEIAAWRAADKGIEASNQLGWHSPRTLFEREEAGFRELAGHIGPAIAQSARRHWKEFDPKRHIAVSEGWVNVSGKGAFNVPHDHVSFHYSGCYYVAVGPDGGGRSGAIEFLSPIGVSSPPLPNGASIAPPKIAIVPRPGRIIIFPSYLRHWVYPNQTDEERVSIAFNVRLGRGAR